MTIGKRDFGVAWLAVSVLIGGSGCDRSPVAVLSGPSPVTVAVPPQTPAALGSLGSYVADVTLSGKVYETGVTGQRPLEGATVYCDACGEYGHTWVTTDSSGFYTFTGLWLLFNPVPLHVMKEGFDDPPGVPPLTGSVKPTGPGWREVTISGHTKFDMHLKRRQ